MKVTTRGRYGLRILLDVALNQERGAVTLGDISKRQKVSRKYLWQIVNPLKAAGLLHVTRGTHGGYVLARAPEAISLLDVVAILEGAVSVVGCLGAPDACERSSACIARLAWGEVEAELTKALRRITLKQLIRKYHDAQGGAADYTI
ncbi:MAG: Rrf2 family transcriptional regulator [Kiritimatiellia bacterium]